MMLDVCCFRPCISPTNRLGAQSTLLVIREAKAEDRHLSTPWIVSCPLASYGRKWTSLFTQTCSSTLHSALVVWLMRKEQTYPCCARRIRKTWPSTRFDQTSISWLVPSDLTCLRHPSPLPTNPAHSSLRRTTRSPPFVSGSQHPWLRLRPSPCPPLPRAATEVMSQEQGKRRRRVSTTPC
jgi:hypothetical protein